jgi:hypothetical protein
MDEPSTAAELVKTITGLARLYAQGPVDQWVGRHCIHIERPSKF